MNWLIWKEYRLNRLILIVGAVLLILPHIMALVLAWYGRGPGPKGGLQWAPNLIFASFYSVAMSQLTLLFLGGHAIACERVDRSAEFLATLPLSRARILAGKITLALMTAALIWGLNLLIVLLATGAVAERVLPQVYSEFQREISPFAITGLVFFCVGWLLSSVLESPTFAICGGLVTPFLIVRALASLGWLFEYDKLHFELWYPVVCLTLSPACFVAGTWYYLRRVEP